MLRNSVIMIVHHMCTQWIKWVYAPLCFKPSKPKLGIPWIEPAAQLWIHGHSLTTVIARHRLFRELSDRRQQQAQVYVYILRMFVCHCNIPESNEAVLVNVLSSVYAFEFPWLAWFVSSHDYDTVLMVIDIVHACGASELHRYITESQSKINTPTGPETCTRKLSDVGYLCWVKPCGLLYPTVEFC